MCAPEARFRRFIRNKNLRVIKNVKQMDEGKGDSLLNMITLVAPESPCTLNPGILAFLYSVRTYAPQVATTG